MTLCRALVTAGWLGILAISYPIAVPAASPTIDFELLYRAAQLANQSYEGESEIIGQYPGVSAWVATPGDTQVQYVLIQNNERQVQVVAVRGTSNRVNWELDMDTRGVRDENTGILMHSGFRTAAEVIYNDVKPHLEPGYTTYLTGHSLGGAVAAILGTYLHDDRFDINGIYTFGQPKFTNEAGARAYADLPLLRVIYQNDTVTLLPDKTSNDGQEFAHTGAVINLFPGPYYAYGTAQQSLEVSQGAFGAVFSQVSVVDHEMRWYLRGLQDKLEGATEVSFSDRNSYIVRHRRGTPHGLEDPIETHYNFNN